MIGLEGTESKLLRTRDQGSCNGMRGQGMVGSQGMLWRSVGKGVLAVSGHWVCDLMSIAIAHVKVWGLRSGDTAPA